MDWKAAMSSEVFRNYVVNELKREELEKLSHAEVLDNEMSEMENILNAMDNFENEIHKHPALLQKFKEAKAFLMRNPDAHGNVDPNFVKGIMMLKLEDK